MAQMHGFDFILSGSFQGVGVAVVGNYDSDFRPDFLLLDGINDGLQVSAVAGSQDSKSYFPFHFNFSAKIWLTILGFAFPLVFFITSPTKNPVNFVSPFL